MEDMYPKNFISTLDDSLNAILNFPLEKLEDPRYNVKFPELTEWLIENYIDGVPYIDINNEMAQWLLNSTLKPESIPHGKFTPRFESEYKKIKHKFARSGKYIYSFLRKLVELYRYYHIDVEPIVFIKTIGVLMHQQWLVDIEDNSLIQNFILETLVNNVEYSGQYVGSNVEEIVKIIEDNNVLLEQVNNINIDKGDVMGSTIFGMVNLEKDVEDIKKMLEDKSLPEETRSFFEYAIKFAENDLKDFVAESKKVEVELVKKGELDDVTREEAAIRIATVAVDNVNRAKKEKEEETAMAENKVNDNVKHNEEIKVTTEVPEKDSYNLNTDKEENIMLENEGRINVNDVEVAEDHDESMPFWKKALIFGGIVAAGFAGYKAYQHFTDGDADEIVDAAVDMASEVVEA